MNVLVAIVTGGFLLLAPVLRGEAAVYVSVDEVGTAYFTGGPAEPHDQSVPDVSLPPGANSVGGEFADLINRTAAEQQVDPNLVKAIIKVESNFDAFAVSPKGARGLMQLMPATADRYAVANVFDPEANIRAGVQYLRDLQAMFPGQLSLALAAYNAGENAVLRSNGIPPYPETRQYVQRVLDLYDRREGAADTSEAGSSTSGARSEVAGAVVLAPSLFSRLEADGTLVYTNLPPGGWTSQHTTR